MKDKKTATAPVVAPVEKPVEQPVAVQTAEEALLASAKEPKAVTIGMNERVVLNAVFFDDFGNKAPLKDVPVWASSNPQVIKCIPSADGMSCDCRPAGVLGTSTVTASGNGDEVIATKVDITVLAGLATKGSIVLQPSEKWNHS